ATAASDTSPLPLHDALPILAIIAAVVAVGVAIWYFRDEIMRALNAAWRFIKEWAGNIWQWLQMAWDKILEGARAAIDWLVQTFVDRKSTRLNSSHVKISYAV